MVKATLISRSGDWKMTFPIQGFKPVLQLARLTRPSNFVTGGIEPPQAAFDAVRYRYVYLAQAQDRDEQFAIYVEEPNG